MKTKYEEILEREFRKHQKISSDVVVKVIYGQEEGGEESNEHIFVIVLDPVQGPLLYMYWIGSDEEDDFEFIEQESGELVSFPIPEDYLDAEFDEDEP